MKTLGSYFLEKDDVPGSNELFAGKLKISGPWSLTRGFRSRHLRDPEGEAGLGRRG